MLFIIYYYELEIQIEEMRSNESQIVQKEIDVIFWSEKLKTNFDSSTFKQTFECKLRVFKKMRYGYMDFIDQVLCSESESSEHDSKEQTFLYSIQFLDNQTDSWSLIISLLQGVNCTFLNKRFISSTANLIIKYSTHRPIFTTFVSDALYLNS